MLPFTYLKKINDIGFVLDHRIVPEVRAMLCAMTSRLPVGGIAARYGELVAAVCGVSIEELVKVGGPAGAAASGWTSGWALRAAEDKLTRYPLHAKVQGFLDEHVGRYGHSSVIELTGGPTVFFEGISWWTAWLLFDSPLVIGQEASTRAMDFSKRGVCVEAGDDPKLAELHDRWMAVFRAEVEVWKADPEVSKDPQPFRPAFDRARWALPGTISTAASFATHIRDRARVIRDGEALARQSKDPEFIRVWQQIRETYAAAVPGIAGYGLREAVVEEGGVNKIPAHLGLVTWRQRPDEDPPVLGVGVNGFAVDPWILQPYARARKGYADPWFNQYRVSTSIPCSLAVARDWHRHRTFYPWVMEIQQTREEMIRIHDFYQPRSALGLKELGGLLIDASTYFNHHAETNPQRARLALPLGTAVIMQGCGGLRDAVYMGELRRDTRGANPEYQPQAAAIMEYITEQCVEVLPERFLNALFPENG